VTGLIAPLLLGEAVAGMGPLAILALVAVGLVSLGLLGAWTVRRLQGRGRDPTLRSSSGGILGSASVVLSGTHAVALVGIVAYLSLLPVVRAPLLLAAVIGGVVAIHAVVEVRELGD